LSVAGVVVQIKGLASDPELMLSWSIIALLEENTAFLMRARCLTLFMGVENYNNLIIILTAALYKAVSDCNNAFL
jgi:hypothetical protein